MSKHLAGEMETMRRLQAARGGWNEEFAGKVLAQYCADSPAFTRERPTYDMSEKLHQEMVKILELEKENQPPPAPHEFAAAVEKVYLTHKRKEAKTRRAAKQAADAAASAVPAGPEEQPAVHPVAVPPAAVPAADTAPASTTTESPPSASDLTTPADCCEGSSDGCGPCCPTGGPAGNPAGGSARPSRGRGNARATRGGRGGKGGRGGG